LEPVFVDDPLNASRGKRMAVLSQRGGNDLGGSLRVEEPGSDDQFGHFRGAPIVTLWPRFASDQGLEALLGKGIANLVVPGLGIVEALGSFARSDFRALALEEHDEF